MSIDVTLSSYAVDGAARPDSFSRMHPRFSTALADMFAAAPPEIQSKLRVSSGYRSPERQGELFEAALAKYGSPAAARRWVAPPGHSMHNHGLAADLKYLSPAARDWAHANASRFGLAFPLDNENWHIELAGARERGVDGLEDAAEAATVLAAASTRRPKSDATPDAAASGLAFVRAERGDDPAPSFATQIALFLLTQHEPPQGAPDRKPASGARLHRAVPVPSLLS